VNMKSRKDVDRNKATVERYARKARMYYSNHPKIKQLLAEVDSEMHAAESKIKSVERKEAVTSFLTNRWFWCASVIIIGIIMVIISASIYNKENEDISYTIGFIGAFMVIGGLYGVVFNALFGGFRRR